MAEIDEVREKFLDTQKTKKKNINDEEDNRWGCWSSKRYFLTAMLFMGAFSIRSIGGNMSIAIIAMTQNRTMIVDNQTIQYEPEFQWNSKMQGLVLSMPGYGYLFSIVAGIAVKKFGGVTTYGWSLLMMGVLSILNPYIARLNYHLLLFGKLLEGLGENWTIVSTIEIWSQWMPKIQRSSLMSIGYTGSYFAQAFNFPICGFLTSFYGWPSTFYYTGGMAVIVSLIILSSFSDDPSCDRYISKKELKMIMRDKEHSSNEKVAYFWKPMLTMKPLWALLVLKIAYASGFSFITICFPLYVKDMTGKKIDQIGIFSGIPNTASIFTVPLFGTLADYLRNKKILNDPQVHRTYVLVACIFGAMCLFAVSFISNFTINIIILMLFKILLSLIYVTKVIYPIYLAPRHSSSVTAITSYGFTFGCTITPMLIGYVVTSHQPYQWNICIFAIGAAMLIASTIFVSFAARKVPDIFRDVPQHKNERSIEHLS